MNHQLNTNNRSTQQQMGSRSQSHQKVGQQIWKNRRFPHIFGTFVHSPPLNPSLKDLIASENEFQQSILMSKSQIKHLENQRNTIKRYLISKGANIQQLAPTTSTVNKGMNTNITGFPNNVVKSNNKHNNNSNILIPNQVLPNEQTIMNNTVTNLTPKNSIQNSLRPINTEKLTNNPNILNNKYKQDPQIRKRKSPGELNKEKSTRKGFNPNDTSFEIKNTHKRQRNNAVSQTRTNNTKKNQIRKKTKRRSNRKKNNTKDENSDDEIKRIIEQINFFDSEDNETDSEEDDFISTRTEPSKVWDHLSPWLEEFTTEAVEFLQQTDLIKEGYSQIPPLYQISWNFQDSPSTNINENSQSHGSSNKSKSEKLRNEIEKSSRVFCRLLGSLIESNTKSSNLAHKNKRLVTQLDQLKNSYQYWRNPKDPRFPRKYNGINTKQIISQSSQYTHSQIPIIQKNGNLSLKAMSELIKVGLIIEPSPNFQQEDDDPIYQRLKILMTQLNKVAKINNKSKQLMYESTKEIVRKENNWKTRFKEILETEKKYKDSISQAKGKKKKKEKK
ncbi:hypothetical protein M0813_28485 [Anaeramoeba flamelloides]|uniref:Transcriptional regulatory protein RXT2 N-terminal domain-containing protein n=1 Tax=Anaeramoeba flamelloides TaxID=1746091 RepID=A0ABQ8XUH2_9EUKA|nr:hypothetical protein M0813_28485 [Anaeramoeba flamelloides]